MSSEEKKDGEKPNDNEKDYSSGKPGSGNPKNPRQKNPLQFLDIELAELEAHLKIIKSTLVKYNTFDYDNQSASKLTSLNLSDINIILNHKTNFTRVKLFIDYLELETTCPNVANAFRNKFIKYYNYTNYLTRKILLSSKKIKEDTSVFSDFILLNYPYTFTTLTKTDILKIAKKKSGVLSFSKCHVIKVGTPFFLLWCKKIYPTCSCNPELRTNKKFFNPFSKNLKYNSNFNKENQCEVCHKEYYHDSKNDIFIECQEIEVLIETDRGILNSKINLFCFGDLINSVKEGNCIALNAYFIQDKINVREKNFDFGYFVAMNFNMCFNSISMLNANNFKIEGNDDDYFTRRAKKNLENLRQNFSEEDSENSSKEIFSQLSTLQFQRQLTVNFYKFLLQNYIGNKQKEISMSIDNENIPIISEYFCSFLNLVLDLSIAQREYYNHISKIDFLQSNNANYFNVKGDKTAQKKSQIKDNADAVNSSRNLVFKTIIFQNLKNINNNGFNSNIGSMTNSNYFPEEKKPLKDSVSSDFKKYFRLSKQLPQSTSTSDVLLKPMNMFLIFDNTKNDPIFKTMLKYSSIYKSLIVLYPFFVNKTDTETLMNFYKCCNNKIVLLNSIDFLTKNEIDVINTLISSNSLDITFWFCCSGNKIEQTSTKKNLYNTSINSNVTQLKIKNFEGILSKCEIVLNLSKRYAKNLNINVINENSFKYFFVDNSQEVLNGDKLLEMYFHYEFINEKFKDTCNKNHFYEKEDDNPYVDSFKAAKLIEDYFISKRNVVKINYDDLFTLLRLAIFSSILRCHYEHKSIIIPSNISNINFTDVFFAIVIYEEICGIKYGMEMRSLDSGKVFFWDYFKEIKRVVDGMVVSGKVEEFKEKKVPKSKTMRKVDLVGNHGSSIIGSKENDVCGTCREIDKVQAGKENLLSFVDKVKLFTYKDFQNYEL